MPNSIVTVPYFVPYFYFLKNHILNPDNVSALTGRLKRRVVLD